MKFNEVYDNFINEAMSVDVRWALKRITSFNKNLFPYNTDNEEPNLKQLTEDIVKDLGYRQTSSNVNSAIDHLGASRGSSDAIPENKTVIKELDRLLK